MAREPSGKGQGALATAEARIRQVLEQRATELNLSRLGLRELPEALGRLTQLETLNLRDNQLTALPEALGRLTQLQRLDLSFNQLTALSEAIGQLTRLQTLHLFGNQLTALPEAIGQLTQLQTLWLSGNRLTALPEAIGQLTQLQTLSLSGNQLTALSEALGRLTQLQWLYLDNNQLTALPEAIGQLTQLQTLDLSGNQLTALPEAIGQLTQLQTLYLSGNRLTALPEGLRNLAALEGLFLHGNDGLGLPAEVLGPILIETLAKSAKPARPATILDYYFRVRAAKRPLNEAKLILVGRGGVGKTSLVNRLLHNTFHREEKKTEGIRISPWRLRLRLRGAEEVGLNIWDFGGQEIMHATHQFFLTQRSLYLLVLEGRQGAEDADAEYWLRLIESFGAESSGEVSPVLVVLNKIKEQPFDLNRTALQRKYPFIRGFVATDCADRIGIEELRTAIEGETDRLPHLRDAFPASWFAIKDRLAGMKESFITFEAYRGLCGEHGEPDASGQDALAGHLHNLGIALNYKDDPRLRDTHVLNPHWVTDGIYRILNAPLLAQQKGELCLDDVEGILPAAEYPRPMHRFLFDLMRKFELCFTFPDDDAHYLIPELLDKQEPAEAASFPPEECLNFEYRYPVLTEGLLPRFIVRTHALSAGLPRWRTGVVLAFEGNRALVKGDVQEKRVSIAVTGPAAGRRRLLAIVRSDLERIHAAISQLQPEAWVLVPGRARMAVPYAKLLALEKKGIRTFPEVVDGDVMELDVPELLNGVDLEGARKKRISPDREGIAADAVRVFCSYCHKDETLLNELKVRLRLLEMEGKIAEWDDRKLMGGDELDKAIDENLNKARIVLLLVSDNYLASATCRKEMNRALERHRLAEAKVISLILRPSRWLKTPLKDLLALPKDGRAVTLWPDRDSAWRDVSDGIERVVEEIREARR